MARALGFLILLLAFGQAQNVVRCDATEVAFDFSAPGPLTIQGGYPVANLAGYLHLFDVGPFLFLPTRVVGGTGSYRVECRIRTRGGGGGGTLCGAGPTYCFRFTGVTGTFPPPLDPNTRLYLMVQVASGPGVINHVPSPTPLGAIPDNRGLASIPRNTQAVLWLYFFLQMDPGGAFSLLPNSGTLTLTYRLSGN